MTTNDPSHDFALAFRFQVGFGAAGQGGDCAFKEVSGLSPEMETEAFSEGGESRYVLNLPKRVKAGRLVLKRGLSTRQSDLVAWCKDVLEGGLGTRIKTQQVRVSLLDEEGQPLETWSLMHAYPVKMEIEGFNAMRNELAIEKIELSYTYSVRGASR